MVGVDPLGELGEGAGGPLAGDPTQDVDVVGRQIDGHPDVADPGGKRPGAATHDRVERAEPAGLQQIARARGPQG